MSNAWPARNCSYVSPQPTGIISRTHSAVGEPHWPPKPMKVGFQTALRSSRLTASVGAMQKPTFWLRTTSFLFADRRLYLANCSKCQWLCPLALSKPMVPARTRPTTFPFL